MVDADFRLAAAKWPLTAYGVGLVLWCAYMGTLGLFAFAFAGAPGPFYWGRHDSFMTVVCEIFLWRDATPLFIVTYEPYMEGD